MSTKIDLQASGLEPGTHTAKRRTNKLTVAAIKNAKPRARPYKMADGGGLTVLVQPDGRRGWRFRYRFAGVEKMLSFGSLDDVSLKAARARRDDARKLLAGDPPIDPSVKRQAEKQDLADTFGAVSAEYLEKHAATISEATRVRDQRILDKLNLKISGRPLNSIKPAELLAALRSIEKTGAHETTHRALNMARRIYAFALASGQATGDPTSGLQAALAPVVSKSRAGLTDPVKVGQLLRDIDNYHGDPVKLAALKLLALTFVRPGELRQAKWSEFDLKTGQWVIPKERMKLRREHIVPLADQAVQLLKELHKVTSKNPSGYAFPSPRAGRCLSENAFSVALKTMGYAGDVHQAHGFRVTASSMLHELNYSAEIIETQLAHARPGVAGIYNRSHLLPQRREMMIQWGDYLDTLRAGTVNVVPIGAKA